MTENTKVYCIWEEHMYGCITTPRLSSQEVVVKNGVLPRSWYLTEDDAIEAYVASLENRIRLAKDLIE